MSDHLSFEQLDRLLGGRTTRELACPICSSQRKAHHRRSPCFGLRRTADDRIVFSCMNCGEQGVRTADWGEKRGGPDRAAQRYRNPSPAAPPKDRREEEYATAHLAAQLWSQTTDPHGTLVEAYWLYRRLELPIPPSVRFHPSHMGRPVMVAAAGLVAPVTAIQRTFLEPDGQGYIKPKKSLGPIKGRPIVVHANPESLALVIGEGVEKTHALARAMNVDGWATAGKSFIPHFVDVVPPTVESVTILVDSGAEPECHQLARGLEARGIEALLTGG